MTYKRGHGKVFYFRPGDQDYPTYFHAGVRRVIANAVEWAVTLRPRRETPVLLRHETEDFYRGFDYTGALDPSARVGS